MTLFGTFAERQAELRAELAEGTTSRRALDIIGELDCIFVDENDLQPDDFVHADGSITRASA